MAESPDLIQRLIDAGRRYHPSARRRGRLARLREALLVHRAMGLTYDEITQLLATHGITISATSVGTFCRRTFSLADIDRARRQLTEPGAASSPTPGPQSAAPAPAAPAAESSLPSTVRGPRIARDVY